MKTIGRYTYLIWIILGLTVINGCGDDDDDDSSSGGCQWKGNCSSIAPEGAYDCDGNSIVQCLNGSWNFVIACGSTDDSDGRPCTCKGGCGTNTVECSFAFDVCDGAQFETCGPNATAEVTDAWRCVPN